MRKTPCYIIVVFSFVLLLFMVTTTRWTDSDMRETMAGGGGRGDDASLPFNFPHPVETITERLPFHYYEDEIMYEAKGDEVERDLSIHEHSLVTHAKEMASQTLVRALPTAAFHSGRYRWLPDGVEHDLLYKDDGSHITKRIILFQKLNNAQIVRSIEVDETKEVHIVTALKDRLDKYEVFLHHLATAILPHDQHLTLTVAYFTSSAIHQLRNITSACLASFPNFKWSLVPLGEGHGDEHFSRGKGLHVGALQAAKEASDLIFFCDVDVLMKPDFFMRCRANTLLGRQVYYPMVFSLYNPHLVYPLQDQGIPPIPQQLKIGEHTGFWREFGYGMSCVSLRDYEDVGGYLDIRVWGGEDEALFQQFLTKEHMKVIRAPDPSLFHLYHSKECATTGDAAYVACLKSRATTEGSKMQLGLALLKIQHGTDLEGLLSKRFYYFWLVPYLGGLLALSLLTNLLLASLLLLWARRAYGCKVL